MNKCWQTLLLITVIIFSSCKKENNNFKEEDNLIYTDEVKKIQITKDISINNGTRMLDPNINLIKYEEFLKHLVNSNRFLIVTQKDFPTTTSTDKVIISLRYDIDDDINTAVRFAHREHKYGIKSTYYVLHTAGYYGETKVNSFKRNNKIIHYIKKIQDDFGQEIGLHNDLVTLQIAYNLDPTFFFKTELNWLRGNGVNVYGSVAHGSEYCYIYHYLNSYFWKHTQPSDLFFNWEYIPKKGETIKIIKDDLVNYNLEYDGDRFSKDYFFADCDRVNGKLWHMGMVNFDTIQPGKKVIILLHPQYWF